MRLLIDNVRCFWGHHELPIAPLTIFLGENSSGKSTAMAMLQSIGDNSRFPVGPRLGTPPYELGPFDTIVSRCSATSPPTSFSIGYREGGHGTPQVVATYRNERNRPVLSRLALGGPACELDINFMERSFTGRISSDDPIELKGEIPQFMSEKFIRSSQGDLFSLVMSIVASASDRPRLSKIFQAVSSTLENRPTAVSVSPIRSRPKRNYEDLDDAYSPDGSDVPRLILKVLKAKTASKERAVLETFLGNFGRKSGLFSDIDVRPLGNREGDPFQLRAKISGRSRSLVDVGYGVSQALPVVVKAVVGGSTGMLLLQQPEVHLHPRAQAELGSLFATLAGKHGRHLVVETHSDYLVDRVRQEISNGTISHQKVQVLFFHRTGAKTQVYKISLNERGDVVAPPNCYRQFFLEEQYRLLTRAANREAK